MILPPVMTGSMGMAMNMSDLDKTALAMVPASDLDTGKATSFDYSFTESVPDGNLEFACHTPGHYEAGMKLPITLK